MQIGAVPMPTEYQYEVPILAIYFICFFLGQPDYNKNGNSLKQGLNQSLVYVPLAEILLDCVMGVYL